MAEATPYPYIIQPTMMQSLITLSLVLVLFSLVRDIMKTLK